MVEPAEDLRQKRGFRRSQLLLCVAAATATVGIVWSMLSGGSTPPQVPDPPESATTSPADERIEHGHGEGPLDAEGPTGTTMTEYDVGDRFTNGLLVLLNTGDQDIVVESVTPVLVGDGLEFLGNLAIGAGREYYAMQDRSWPPEDPAVAEAGPLEGAVVFAAGPDSERGLNVLMGYEVTARGRTTVPEVVVDYTVGEDRYRAHFINTIAVCPGVAREECPDETGDL